MNVEQKALSEIVRESLLLRRHAIVYSIARMLLNQLHAYSCETSIPAGNDADNWTGVYSLSQLRSTVGGRFSNLKDKWIEAGFPLRAHRGDRAEPAEVKADGWLELSTWIGKQGFETRLPASGEDFLFAARKFPSGKME